jgi:hypothetical protein
MRGIDFTAWSIYTGPSNLKSVYEGSNWITGQWDAINDAVSASEIQRDIEARINLITNTFQTILDRHKTWNRFFIIPEFFFRCKQGPYPYLKVDGVDYPLEYIQKRLKEELTKIIPNDNCYYNFFSGTVLTSNISDYSQFLASAPVVERMKELNRCLAIEDGAALRSFSSKQPAVTWNREIFNHDRKEGLKTSSGSSDALDNFMKQARMNPLCTVRNRGLYLHFNKTMMQEMESFICEKQYESTVDLTMGILRDGKIEHGGMITEWMAGYPSISILGGDKQADSFSTNARFTPRFLGFSDVGVEICLDHRKQRLRRTVDMCRNNGADVDNYPLWNQIISSGGMQILDYAVAAHGEQSIFNADGCDKIYKVYGDDSTVILNGEAGIFTGIATGVYSKSVQSKWAGKDGQTYYSHSQLAFCTKDSKVGGFNNARGLKNDMAQTYTGSQDTPSNPQTDSCEPQIISDGLRQATDLFGATTGELHHYF